MIGKQYVREALFREIGEFYVCFVCFKCAVLTLVIGEFLFMNSALVYISTFSLSSLGFIYLKNGLYLYRFQKNLKILKPYKIKASKIATTDKYVSLGRGFEWLPKHTQRLKDTMLPKNEKFTRHSHLHKKVRNFVLKNEDSEDLKLLIKFSGSSTESFVIGSPFFSSLITVAPSNKPSGIKLSVFATG